MSLLNSCYSLAVNAYNYFVADNQEEYQEEYDAPDLLEQDCITTQLGSIEETINRFDELTSKNRWTGRIELSTFTNIRERLENYSRQFGPTVSEFVKESRARLFTLTERFTQLNRPTTGAVGQLAIELLPDEVCKNIFSFCSAKDLGNLSLVSWKISQLTNDPMVWEPLCLKEVPVQANLLKMTWKQFYQNALCSNKYQKDDPTFITIVMNRFSLCPFNKSCIQLNQSEEESLEKVGLNSLPNELFINIFSFCSAKDLGNLSLVSSKICQLTNHPKVWWSLCLKNIPVEIQPIPISWKQFYFNATNPHQYRDGCMIFVRGLNGKTSAHEINLNSDWVQANHFKRIIKIDNDLTCAIDQMRLIFCGKEIGDDLCLKPLNLHKEGSMFLIVKGILKI
jgi:hypothetical protein